MVLILTELKGLVRESFLYMMKYVVLPVIAPLIVWFVLASTLSELGVESKPFDLPLKSDLLS